MKSVFTAAGLAALLLAAAPAALAQGAPSEAAAVFQATTLNLSAFGETRVTPDMATISLGVTTEKLTAAEASRANAAAMAAAVAALKKAGIEGRDIQTSNLSLNAQYAYEQNQPPRLSGYQAANQVTVTVRDLSRLGPVLDAVVAAGANTVQGVTLGLQNPQAAEDAARREAVKALNAKAALYAQATGLKLARLVNLSEGGGYQPVPAPPVYMMAKAARSEATPVEAGELKVRVDVSGVFELAR
jgi:uncharacterized protein